MMKFGCRIALYSAALIVFVAMSAGEARACGCGPCGEVKSPCGDWKAAKLAQYDLDGDGTLSVLEQAKMRLAWKMKSGVPAGKCGAKAACCGVCSPAGSCVKSVGGPGYYGKCGAKAACCGVCSPAGSCVKSVGGCGAGCRCGVSAKCGYSACGLKVGKCGGRHQPRHPRGLRCDAGVCR